MERHQGQSYPSPLPTLSVSERRATLPSMRRRGRGTPSPPRHPQRRAYALPPLPQGSRRERSMNGHHYWYEKERLCQGCAVMYLPTGKRQNYCTKACRLSVLPEMQHRRANATARRLRLRAANLALIAAAKANGCSRCDEGDPVCLDFHHRDESQKVFAIAQRTNTALPAAMEAELAKCIVVCSNCHRKLHHAEGTGAWASSTKGGWPVAA
jgi:hypothetical protein